jgi:hypothetical protein
MSLHLFAGLRVRDFEAATRKVIYRDPDGNEIAFGGAPLDGGS